jgi:hypothetical protein
MRISSNIYLLIGAVLTFYFCLKYYKRTPQSDSGQNKARAQQAAESPPNREPLVPAKLATAEEPQNPLKPAELSGIGLLPKLGAVLSTSVLEELQKSGDIPGLQAAVLESGGKCYALEVNSGGGLVLHLGKDNALLAFGFVSNTGVAPSDEEQRLLMEFNLSGQPTVTVLDERFEGVKMQIQTYESKVFPKKNALVYSKGRSRTLVFFDSSRVEMRKLLPASPDTIDPAMLKQLRSLLEPTK